MKENSPSTYIDKKQTSTYKISNKDIEVLNNSHLLNKQSKMDQSGSQYSILHPQCSNNQVRISHKNISAFDSIKNPDDSQLTPFYASNRSIKNDISYNMQSQAEKAHYNSEDEYYLSKSNNYVLKKSIQELQTQPNVQTQECEMDYLNLDLTSNNHDNQNSQIQYSNIDIKEQGEFNDNEEQTGYKQNFKVQHKYNQKVDQEEYNQNQTDNDGSNSEEYPNEIKDNEHKLTNLDQKNKDQGFTQQLQLLKQKQINDITRLKRCSILSNVSNRARGDSVLKAKFMNQLSPKKQKRVLMQQAKYGTDSPKDIDRKEMSHITQFIQNYKEKRDYLLVFHFIKKFISSLLIQISYRNYKFLQRKHYKVIDDKSIILNNLKLNKFQTKSTYIQKYQLFLHNQKLQNTLLDERRLTMHSNPDIIFNPKLVFQKLLFNFKEYIVHCCFFKTKVLQPNSLVMVIWETIMLLMLSILFFIIPLNYSFQINTFQITQWQFIIYKLPIILFVVNVILGFHKGYYEYGFPVLDKKKVALFYLQNSFWKDIISIILLGYNQYYFEYPLCLILQIKSERFPIMYDFATLILKVLYLAHIFGCGFNLISLLTQDDLRGCWLKHQDLLDSNWVEYIITMITIGYGDIYPINIYEKIYVILMTFLSCGLFAYCLNQIGEIFRDIKLKNQEYKQQTYILSKYLNRMNISNNTKIKFLRYTEYIHKAVDIYQIKGQQIFNKCPLDLKEQVQKEYYGKILLNYKIFKQCFSHRFLMSLCLKMKEQSWGPGETILNVGQCTKILYFINNGDLEYFHQNGLSNKSLQKLPQVIYDYNKVSLTIIVDKEITIIKQRVQILLIEYQAYYKQYLHSKFNQKLTLIIQIKLTVIRLFMTHQPCKISVRTKTQTSAAYITYDDFIEVINSFQSDKESFQQIKDEFLNSNQFDIGCSLCGAFSHDISECPSVHYKMNQKTSGFKVFQSHSQERSYIDCQQRIVKFPTLLQSNIINNELRKVRFNNLKDTYQLFQDSDLFNEYQYNLSDKDFFISTPCINIKNSSTLFDEFFLDKHSIIPKKSIFTAYSQNQENTYYQYQSCSQTLSEDDKSETSNDEDNQQIKQQIVSEINKREYQNTRKSMFKKQTSNENVIDEDEEENLGLQRVQEEQYIKPFQLSKMLKDDQNLINMKQSVVFKKNSEPDINLNNASNKFKRESDLKVVRKRESDGNGQFPSSLKVLSLNSRQSYDQQQSISNLLKSTLKDYKRVSSKISNDILLQELQKRKSRNHQSITSSRHSSFFKDSKKLSNYFGKASMIALGPLRNSYIYPYDQKEENQIPKVNEVVEGDNQQYVQNLNIIANNQTHIFGPLQFEFDKIKEYLIYYPLYNYQNVIKNVKKIQNIQTNILQKKKKV